MPDPTEPSDHFEIVLPPDLQRLYIKLLGVGRIDHVQMEANHREVLQAIRRAALVVVGIVCTSHYLSRLASMPLTGKSDLETLAWAILYMVLFGAPILAGWYLLFEYKDED